MQEFPLGQFDKTDKTHFLITHGCTFSVWEVNTVTPSTHTTTNKGNALLSVLLPFAAQKSLALCSQIATMVMGTRLPAFIALCLTGSIVYAQQQAVRINCGGPAHRDSGGNNWIADQHYSKGKPWKTSKAISNTISDTLLQSERFTTPEEPMKYVVPVKNGVYDVRLHWSENNEEKAGARVFHVIIEGILAMTNVDIYKAAGNKGFYKIDKVFRVTAVGGVLTIEFAPVKGNPKVNAIEIIPVSPTAPHPDIRAVVNVLGADPLGIKWADSYSVGDNCYCDQVTSYDHGIATIQVETQLGWMTIQEACKLLGPGPGIKGRPIYNDAQCGNGPHNDEGDEQMCPGRVDIGKTGCGHIGPKWNFGRFVSDTSVKRVFLDAGGPTDDESLVSPSDSWTYVSKDMTITKNGSISSSVFRSHRSAQDVLTYTIGGFLAGKMYRVSLGFAEVWMPTCAKGKRVMSITINNSKYSDNLDVYQEAGCGGALVKSFVLNSDGNGTFKIVIGATKENPMVSLIEITDP
jgi:hypothetical protein